MSHDESRKQLAHTLAEQMLAALPPRQVGYLQPKVGAILLQGHDDFDIEASEAFIADKQAEYALLL